MNGPCRWLWRVIGTRRGMRSRPGHRTEKSNEERGQELRFHLVSLQSGGAWLRSFVTLVDRSNRTRTVGDQRQVFLPVPHRASPVARAPAEPSAPLGERSRLLDESGMPSTATSS